uniref:Uncharacterized protein n=1 Tax=Arundo donax TaxID=35708 RepID=A0A0A9DL07_ARUDO
MHELPAVANRPKSPLLLHLLLLYRLTPICRRRRSRSRPTPPRSIAGDPPIRGLLCAIEATQLPGSTASIARAHAHDGAAVLDCISASVMKMHPLLGFQIQEENQFHSDPFFEKIDSPAWTFSACRCKKAACAS